MTQKWDSKIYFKKKIPYVPVKSENERLSTSCAEIQKW